MYYQASWFEKNTSSEALYTTTNEPRLCMITLPEGKEREEEEEE